MVISESKPGAMSNSRVLYAAAAATGAMTLFMWIAPMIGLPGMNVGELLGTIFKGSTTLGWVMHLITGFIFAYLYVLFFNDWLPVENPISRGAMYGIIVFILAEIIITLVNLSGLLHWWEKEGMAMMIFGNLLAHLIFGSVLGAFFRER